MLKPTVPEDETRRLMVLRALEILDTPPEERFDRITRVAAHLVGAPIALISLVDTNRQWFKSRFGLDAPETPRDVSFCGHAIHRDEPFVIPDALADARFADNPLVTGEPLVRFYAGAPLKVGQGSAVGTLCVIDHQPRMLSPETTRALTDLADIVAHELQAVQLSRAIDRIQPVVQLDPAGHVLHANRAWMELFGHASDDLAGVSFCALSQEPADAALWGRLAAGEGCAREQRLVYRGSEVWVQASFNPIGGGATPLEKVIVLATDVSERKRAQLALESKVELLLADLATFERGETISGSVMGAGPIGRLGEGLTRFLGEKAALDDALAEQSRELVLLTKKLERSNADLREFTHIASHDLQEPLRGLGNYARFILEDCGEQLDAETTQRLERMIAMANRLQRLIDALLKYSLVGHIEFAYERVDLDRVVDEVLEVIPFSLEERSVEVRRQPLPAARCDGTRIAEVFRNLIVNAIKYSDAEHPWIEIGHDGGAYVVRDNGIGIETRDREAVFKIFKRLNRQDRYGGGTGAGLTIVKTIVERHGGKVWVESTPGGGSTFRFTLPSALSSPANRAA